MFICAEDTVIKTTSSTSALKADQQEVLDKTYFWLTKQ